MTERIINVGANDQYDAFTSIDGITRYVVRRNGSGFEGEGTGVLLKLPDGTILDPSEQPVSGGPAVPMVTDWTNFKGFASNPDYDPKTGTWKGKGRGY